MKVIIENEDGESIHVENVSKAIELDREAVQVYTESVDGGSPASFLTGDAETIEGSIVIAEDE